MLALNIIIGILLFFTFILSLKAKITIAYSDEVSLSVKVLFFKINILPSKEKGKGPHSMSAKKAKKIRKKLEAKEKKKAEAKKAKAKAKAEKKKAKAATKKKKSLGEILDMITLVKALVAKVIKKFWRHLRIDIARIKLKIATGDAASCAVAYGAITAAITTLFPLLERVKNFSLPDANEIEVCADFLGDGIEADIKISFSLRVWHLFDVALGAAATFIKHTFKRMLKQAKQN